MTRAPWFVQALEPYSPDLVQLAQSATGTLMKDGTLDVKTKSLIMLALEIADGNKAGTADLAGVCRRVGATDAEIADVVRVVYLQAGLGRLSASVSAFPNASHPLDTAESAAL